MERFHSENLFGLYNVLTQTGEVSRKNRRSEFDDILSHVFLARSINAQS
jgi:hypothetical protein